MNLKLFIIEVNLKLFIIEAKKIGQGDCNNFAKKTKNIFCSLREKKSKSDKCQIVIANDVLLVCWVDIMLYI